VTDQVNKETCADPGQLFLPVEELFPGWKRVPNGTRGLNRDEKAAKALYEQQAADGEALVSLADHQESYELLAQEYADFRAASDDQLSESRAENARLVTRIDELTVRGQIEAVTLCQLAVMMPDSQLEPVGDGEVQFRNKYGAYQVVYDREVDGDVELEISSPLAYAPLYTAVDSQGIPADGVVMIAGYLGLEEGPELTKRSREKFQLEPPEPAKGQSLQQFVAELAAFDLEGSLSLPADKAVTERHGDATYDDASNTEPPASV
jgi:hypothetical protein